MKKSAVRALSAGTVTVRHGACRLYTRYRTTRSIKRQNLDGGRTQLPNSELDSATTVATMAARRSLMALVTSAALGCSIWMERSLSHASFRRCVRPRRARAIAPGRDTHDHSPRPREGQCVILCWWSGGYEWGNGESGVHGVCRDVDAVLGYMCCIGLFCSILYCTVLPAGDAGQMEVAARVHWMRQA